MPLTLFHPVVSGWFADRFGEPTEAQRRGWPAIARGEDTLIAAPTGSGKTLAAFLFCLDRLLRRGVEAPLPDETEVVYISPLKALSNDVEKNLAQPLAELELRMAARLLGIPGVRAVVRTGDTPSSERQKMARRPPHILITTPESLYILLTARRSREALRTVRTVIVDEIHALAGNKRGAHLALTLERLEANAEVRPTRIGLSATQRPIEEVARFLVGNRGAPGDAAPPCTIVDAGQRRRSIDLAVEIAAGHVLGSVATHEQWDTIYDRIAELAGQHRTTLVFCNTRRLVERAAHALGQRLGEDQVAAHHGSLASRTRHDAEQKLKNQEVKLVVATASLELGLDVGAVELVVQLGTTRSLSVLIQRVGRSGHWLGGTPKGRLFATTRDDLIECASLVRAARAGELDRVAVRRHPLDVLAQQLVAECAAAEWSDDALFAMVRRSWPYRNLERREFDQVLTMLADGISARRGRAGAHLHWDRVNGKVRGRRGARLSAMTSGGAIPDVADYAVIADPEGVRVGTLDEDFAIESMRGDIFLLGNTSWRIRRVEAGTVRVEDAHGAPPSVPFWNGEAPGRSAEASQAVSETRIEMERRLVEEGAASAAAWLVAECGLDEEAARQAVEYLAAGRAALGVVPTADTIVAERFFDEAGGMQLVLHAPVGARTNRAWGLALRKRFCRSFNFELQAAATDDGIVISLGPQHSFPLEMVFRFVASQKLEYLLTQALLGAPMFPTRWRWTVTRALAVLRSRSGKRVPPPLQRMRSDDLMAAVFPDQAACPENLGGGDIVLPDHPLVTETVRDCLAEPLDLEGARALLERIESGQIRVVARDLTGPSPFSEAILNANPYAFLDDAPLEERRTRAVMTRRQGRGNDQGDLGALDAAAILQTVADAQPPSRDPDELHDALLSLIVIPEPDAAHAGAHAQALVADRRMSRATVGKDASKRTFWVAAERLPIAAAAYPGIAFAPELTVPASVLAAAAEESAEGAQAAAHTRIVRAWMEVAGPITAEVLAAKLALSTEEVEAALAQLESEGQVLRGRFTPTLAPSSTVEWCDRRLLARIHHLTLGRLRREIAPVTPAELMRFLFRWQHVQPGTQLEGEGGLREVIGQLQGFEVAAAAWEREVLPRRIARYQPSLLDELCWRGEVVWGRLSPRQPPAQGLVRPPTTTRAAPIALVRRSDLGLFLDGERGKDEARSQLGPIAVEVLDHLDRRGASFFHDLVRALRRLPTEIAAALGELVGAGLVTGDSFAALRSLFGQGDPRREPDRPPALPPGRLRRADDLRQHSTGRWSLLRHEPELDETPTSQSPAEARARQLLHRYGVVFRDLLEREPRARWSEVLPALRRMESRGELRGGHFVAGFVGEQFALPEAVETLRQVRRTSGGTGDAPEMVLLAGTDPLNLVGIVTPGPRVPSVGGNLILFRNGVPLASREAGSIVERALLDPDERLRAARLLDPAHLARLDREARETAPPPVAALAASSDA